MGELTGRDLISEITALHNEIVGNLRRSLDAAIRIGELLTGQKESLGHGHFTGWVKDNLPFTERTAQNYMRIYRNRDRLKSETISDLTESYKLLKGRQGIPSVRDEVQEAVKECQEIEDEVVVLDQLARGAELAEGQEGMRLLELVHRKAVELEERAFKFKMVMARKCGGALSELEDRGLSYEDASWLAQIAESELLDLWNQRHVQGRG